MAQIHPCNLWDTLSAWRSFNMRKAFPTDGTDHPTDITDFRVIVGKLFPPGGVFKIEDYFPKMRQIFLCNLCFIRVICGKLFPPEGVLESKIISHR